MKKNKAKDVTTTEWRKTQWAIPRYGLLNFAPDWSYNKLDNHITNYMLIYESTKCQI